MTGAEVKHQLDIIVDKYEALEGRPRSQTHRDSLGIAAMEILLQWRRTRPKPKQQELKFKKGPEVPTTWPVMRVRRRRWNGECRKCHRSADVGQRVAWDPESGRPSTWQHVSCEEPFGGKEK